MKQGNVKSRAFAVGIGLAGFLFAGSIGMARQAAGEQVKSEVVTKNRAAEKKKAVSKRPVVKPDLADVPYGTHERQKLDFYRAESSKPTPLVLFIHGGGWVNGDKSSVQNFLEISKLLNAGISVVAVQYRMVPDAQAHGVRPPVRWPLEDARRAIQFVRSKAGEWNVDKALIFASGGSAGACSSLWLAMHDDMAEPESEDPVARESTRLSGAVVAGAQTTLDPKMTREWMPNMTYGGHAFGFRKDRGGAAEFQRFFAGRDEILPWIREYSPIEHLSADDPPMILLYNGDTKVVKGTPQKDPTHSPILGKMMEERARPLGVRVVVSYPAERVEPYRVPTDSLISLISEIR